MLQIKQQKKLLQLMEYKIKSDNEFQIYKIQEKSKIKEKRLQTKLYYQKQRTYEARVIGMLILCAGIAFAYQAWYTTDVLVSFLNSIYQTIQSPFLSNWQSLLLNESSYLYGYIAQGINSCIRLLLLMGVCVKKAFLVSLQLLTALASTGNMGAVVAVLLVTVLMTVTILKIYISDFRIASPLLWISFQAPK